MSKTEWLVLFLLFLAYLFLGASVFYKIERDLEEEHRSQAETRESHLRDLITRQYAIISNDDPLKDLVTNLSLYCNENFARILTAETNSTVEQPYVYTWTYYNAFFFALTTLSTIGYGNLKPSTDTGKIIVIFYALFGIPFNGIVLAQMGDFFGSVFLRAHHRYKNHVYVSKMNLILDILLYLVPGMVVFIFAPTFVFQYFEGWSFCDSIYYAFVTLSTIGFGDLVAGQSPNERAADTVYKIFLLIWIMFGLGYLVMILGFISRAMKSKSLNKIERKLAHTIKQTQSKIWHEFVDDINYIRRAINETYINRVKPVYKDKKPLLKEKRLTSSMPDLTEWPTLRRRSEIDRIRENEDTLGRRRRRRAFSEHDDSFQIEQSLPRVMSEGALGDIDKVATFRNRPRPSLAAIDHETEELLANLVNQRRMSVYDEPGNHDGGINLFTDDEILNGELYNTRNSSSSWTRPKRSRAASEVPYLADMGPGYDRQKTWAGVDSLHTRTMLKNMRAKDGDWENGMPKEGKDKSSNSFRRLSMAAMNFFSGEKKKKLSKEKLKKERRTGNTFLRSDSGPITWQDNDPKYISENYNSQNGRRPSLLDVLTSPGTGQSTPMSPVLEQTSLADFLRVMSTLRKLEEQQTPASGGIRSRHPSLSYLFNSQLPREASRTREASSSTGNLSRDRRFSQVPPRPERVAYRRRASSISPDRVEEYPRNPPTGRFTPPARALSPPIPPTVVVTSPDGHHRFSVHNVASPPRNDNLLGPRRRRGESLSDLNSRQ